MLYRRMEKMVSALAQLPENVFFYVVLAARTCGRRVVVYMLGKRLAEQRVVGFAANWYKSAVCEKRW